MTGNKYIWNNLSMWIDSSNYKFYEVSIQIKFFQWKHSIQIDRCCEYKIYTIWNIKYLLTIFIWLHVEMINFLISHSVMSDSLRPMDCSMPGFPVHHQLPELVQTHVYRVGDAIQPSHPLSSPSSPAFSLPRIRVFSNESAFLIR